MFERLRSFFAASKLPPPDQPKVRPGGRAFPTHMTTTKPADSVIPKTDRRLQNTDVLTYRTGGTDAKVIADFAAASPTLSAAVWYYIRLAIPENYTVMARSLDGVFDEEATRAMYDLTARMDRVTIYSDGFSGVSTLRNISESLARELITYGACSFELVLDKARLPQRLQPLSVTKIQFIQDGKMLRPIMDVGGEKIDLDLPTVFYTSIDQSLLDVYAESPIATAIKPVLFAEEFFQDLHRVMKRVAFPRTVVKIDYDKFVKNGLSQEAQLDPDKARAEMNTLIAQVETKMSGLRPEEALVLLDTLGIETQANGAGSTSDSYQTLREIAESRIASGAKSLGSVLGHSGTGSQNIASTQSMLAVKSADAAIRMKLNDVYSRALTLAARLIGYDVEVSFKYDAIDLRPTLELEAFFQSKQQRVLELLSLGLITDAEATIQLTGSLPPVGYKPLSGTFFKGNNSPEVKIESPSNNGSALNQNLQPDTPTQGRGQNKKADDDLLEHEAADPQPTFVTPNINIAIDNTQQKASVLKMKRDEDGNLTIERVEDAA